MNKNVNYSFFHSLEISQGYSIVHPRCAKFLTVSTGGEILLCQIWACVLILDMSKCPIILNMIIVYHYHKYESILCFINPQHTCAKGLQYSVCLSVSQSFCHTTKSRTRKWQSPEVWNKHQNVALNILSPFNLPEFFISTSLFSKS